MSEKENQELEGEEGGEEFGELIKYTGGGFAAGILSGALLDHFGFQGSAIGQWIVRTLSGEGESIFEGIFAIRKRWPAPADPWPRHTVGASSWAWGSPGSSIGAAACWA